MSVRVLCIDDDRRLQELLVSWLGQNGVQVTPAYDGQSGIQELSGNATMLYYMTEEAKEFSSAQREKRKPKAEKFPWLP